jgi:SAM-dependent methyltransferase
VHEFLDVLPQGGRVLDLGCAGGSFAAEQRKIIRVDLERPDTAPANFVLADGARLPFAAASFDLIVSNHSLEHIEDLDAALSEIARVVKPGGALYVAVPDASTFADRFYRWLARGGGHVNAFRSAEDLGARLGRASGLALRATRTLCTSLSCLNRKNRTGRGPRRLWLLAGGAEPVLVAFTRLLRACDRWFGTRLSIYGWAFYLANFEIEIDQAARTNVCVRCGSGHAAAWLRSVDAVGRWWGLKSYRCPHCGARNLFT